MPKTRITKSILPKAVSEQDADLLVSALIALVGRRVRAARKEVGLARRELSDRSGVSQRYLAQLESGDGNISIGLLKRIAIALECSLGSLLIEDDDISIESNQIVALYREADAGTRARIQQILDPRRIRERKAERICLLGLRGAGKSALGALLGKDLGFEFIELNEQIERAAGMPVAEVIALYGQEGYRELEAESLDKVIESHQRVVLAVAGGVVSDSETFTKLLSRFNTVWIKASPNEHMERVRAQGDIRPMADNPQAMAQLRQILKNREAKYSQADYHLDTTARLLDQSHAELTQILVDEDFLKNI